MPANPGQKRNQERKKQRRDAAQKARRAANAAAAARAPKVDPEAEAAAREAMEAEDGPAVFVDERGRAIDFDDLDDRNDAIEEAVKKKKLDEAEKLANELSKRFPDHSDGLLHLAKLHELRGDLGKARAALKLAATRKNPGDEEILQTIARERARLGD
jgi:hypothetical protein